MKHPKKSQSAMEFIVIASFMLLVILGVAALTSSKVLEAREEGDKKIAEDIANFAFREIEIAKSVNDGYSRIFNLPNEVNGNKYVIKIIDNKELVVNYMNKEFLRFLPDKICGDMFIPQNKIDKENDVICVNSNLDITQCQNSQNLGFCDSIDDELLPGAKCCCCSRYGICC